MTLILGRKQGMTHIFTEDGEQVGVTVLAAGPCAVTQVRTSEKDGYDAVQLGYEDVPDRRVRKPQRGQFQKVGAAPKRFLREERRKGPVEEELGSLVTVEVFQPGQLVDVVGTSRGRGFAGTVRRHGFSRGPETHGSMNVRRPGSIGTKRTGKLFPGKRMAGQMGARRHTTKNLEVVRVDAARNLLFVKGAVPGPRGGFVEIRTARTGVPRKAEAKA